MAIRSVPSEAARYVVTEQGRRDLVVADTCECDPRLAGLLLECPECGTIYGSMRNSGPWNGVARGKRS